MKDFLHQFLLFIARVLLGCLLGCIILLFYASKSQVVREEIKKSLQKTFKNEFNCDWDGHVEFVNLLTLHVQVKDVSVLPCNRADGWSLYIDTFELSASLFDFLFYRRFSCHSYFQDTILYEKQVDQSSHFAQILAKMFQGDMPANISFDYITIKNGQVALEDSSSTMRISYRYNCQMSRERDGLHTKLYMLDGQVSYKNCTLCDHLLGNFVLIYPYTQDFQDIYARVDCRLSIPALQEKSSCFLVGDLYATRGAFVLSNEDQSFIIEPLKLRLKPSSIPFTCALSMQADVVQRIVAQQLLDEDLTGNITMTVTGNLLDCASSLQGQVELNSIYYKHNLMLQNAVCSIRKLSDLYAIKLFCQDQQYLDGTMKYENGLYTCTIKNIVPLPLWWNRYWHIPALQGELVGTVSHDLSQAFGSYHANLESLKLAMKASLDGSCEFDDHTIACKGTFIDTHYQGKIALTPDIHLVDFRCYNDHETLLDFHEQAMPLHGIAGFVGFNFVKQLVSDAYKSSFSQTGKFDMQGYLENGCYRAQVITDHAYIRIPSLYNVLQNLKATATFDFIGKSIMVENLAADLYEGSLYSDHAVAFFDQQARPSFLYVPLFLNNVLMNWNKGIFGIVSGRLCLAQEVGQTPKFEGNLIVDKAQLKGNIFSQEFQDQLIGSVGMSNDVDIDYALDIAVETREPVVVETSFLKAAVHLDLHIGNTVKKPELEGSIDITSGELKFPYKSLFITHGQIMIMPRQSTEPSIEFEAKGKIKRYDITMRATGTMMDQQIHFESSPYLTEEQIISLLLAGSQDSSLSVVMQAMFMQKLHEIIFGPAISKSKLDLIFNRLLQSFKKIRIFPQFTNQTGRGGVRGIVEVDATDRLHGRIDTNLMQLEDTIFEADYLVTDDVTIRAIKDGPSTYGGEVEMRWKFS